MRDAILQHLSLFDFINNKQSLERSSVQAASERLKVTLSSPKTKPDSVTFIISELQDIFISESFFSNFNLLFYLIVVILSAIKIIHISTLYL